MEDDTVFQALADPTRREILHLIGRREAVTVTEIAASFPHMSRNAVSAHLRILRLANLVEKRSEGRFRIYSLGSNRADAVVSFLMSVYHDSLDQLRETLLQQEPGEGTTEKIA